MYLIGQPADSRGFYFGNKFQICREVKQPY